ncbi:MAG: tyrosine--tRNA ligase [Firmicutes bacterium]|nr:tyrosine--tRNA ligase [Bacillota bacterium]
MTNALDILEQRGFVKQITHPEELRKRLERPLTFYCGFDASADSLHVGHLLPLMAMANLQRAGHRPLAVIGGGTAMIGDPSGKTEMRKMLNRETIDANAQALARQVAKFINLEQAGAGVVLNNADWLSELNYIEFLRDIGSHFSVNRMLTYECFKSRMERGLSFIEFNYMLLQSYDFLTLYRKHECVLQVGGDDQWSNIISGADLIRRVDQGEAFGLTFPLLETSDGKKMGKTEAGAVWLSPERLSPYDFYQFWRNTHDDDVARFMKLYTFLPVAEIEELTAQKGEAINKAKTVLAYEVTKLVHGEAEAVRAREAASALFGAGAGGDSVPSTTLKAEPVNILDLLVASGLAASKSEGRRLVSQGGIYLADERVTDIELMVDPQDYGDKLIVRKGKKVYHQITFQ